MDWTRDVRKAEQHQRLERNISHSLLAARVMELRVPFQLNKDKFTTTLDVLTDVSSSALDMIRSLAMWSEQIRSLTDERDALTRCKAKEYAPLFRELELTYPQEALVLEAREAAAAAVRKRGQEVGAWQKQHEAAFQAIRSRELQRIRGSCPPYASCRSLCTRAAPTSRPACLPPPPPNTPHRAPSLSIGRGWLPHLLRNVC